MQQHDVGEYMEKNRGRYLLVNSIARRTRDLQSGHRPLVKYVAGSLLDTACEEFRQGKMLVSTHSDEVLEA